MKNVTTTALAALTLSTLAHAHDKAPADSTLWNGARPDGHAPISVMGEHTHNAGEWMFSYRYMKMHMEDIYNGDSKVSNTTGETNYMMRPEDMDMEMHMFGTMWAPTDELTLMAMTNYISNSMKMLRGNAPAPAALRTMESEGWGDTSIGGLYKFLDTDKQRAHFGLSLSLPTGSTDEKLPNGFDQPFGMQLGTGTYDLLPSITYLHQPSDFWSYGAQLKGRIHLGRNDEGFSFGDKIEATTWVARNVAEWASVSFRLGASHWGSVDGDTNNSVNQPGAMLPPGITAMALLADADNTGGTRIDAGVGLNLWHPGNGFRVASEFTVPVYQNLNGYQLGQDWTLTVGTQYAW